MQQGSDIWEAAGYLGMSPELLERVYGHHHPDFQSDVAERMSGQKRDRNPVNKKAQVTMNDDEKRQLFKEYKVKQDVRDAGFAGSLCIRSIRAAEKEQFGISHAD